MKKHLRLIFVLAISLLFLASCKDSKQQQVSSERHKIVVGLDDSFPPMGFRDAKNNIVGFDIDLARAAAKKLNLEVEFKPIDWNAKEAVLGSKRVDVLWNGLTITEQRKAKINFTSPYLENRQIIIVKYGSEIKNKADLSHKTVGLQEGSSSLDAINRDQKTKGLFKELKMYPDNVSALMNLDIGRIDALVVDEVVGRYYIAKKPKKYRVLDENFGTEEYGVGVSKDNLDLLNKLQTALNTIKKDGTAAKISEKWFGKDLIKR